MGLMSLPLKDMQYQHCVTNPHNFNTYAAIYNGIISHCVSSPNTVIQ